MSGFETPGTVPTTAPGQQPPGPLRTGALAWALGFLAYIPVPIVGQLAGVFAQAIVATKLRQRPGIEGEQGRHAANWAWTYLAVSLVLAVVVILGGTLANATGGGDSLATPVALTALGVWLFGLNLVHIIVTIIGTLKASRAQIFRCPVAIPFLRG